MTNGDRIRASTDEELAGSIYLRCKHCVYTSFVRDDDPWHCMKLGWDCKDGKKRWLQQEERKE